MRTFFITFIFILSFKITAQEVLKTKNTEAILYVGSSNNNSKPLIVGLGGSEGGNAWASNYWEKTRNKFLEKGYAFLAIGYFGSKNTPKLLEKIEIEDIYNSIIEATKNKNIDRKRVAIIGGSRGADLALLVGSYFKDINCIIGLVPSHAVFPGNTNHFSTSSWTFKNKELPFIPVNNAAIPFLKKRDLRGTFSAMLKDTVAEKKALINVEKIKGSILLISATEDEVAPTTTMANKIIKRLKENNFKYYYNHVPIKGSHSEPLKHFDLVFDFLDKNFPAK
ncbi:alpha/beta hydrolase [Tenacibaculum sp. S7007]|uniref:Alpha/beta hydrolase n=1 Tax=Tenacibaculum pelagium TaxID=2759527 RepID=A0A839AS91_9FLAO|nr:acyl-CoA thioester hydrolase/BAAT C-terminal domain-containing protein [Tenacibaculum pelagium]MBA6157346.1 alpha/beta hydrolase [Tenacibaculum pelagium]